MTTLDIIVNVLLTIFALTGMYCIAHKNKMGFVLFFGVEISMTYIGIRSGQYGLVSSAMLYLGANIYSYRQWSK